MGFALVLLGVIWIVSLAGCGPRISSESVRERDALRKETAKQMPGEKVPLDPADESR
jgi:hypothetical protein